MTNLSTGKAEENTQIKKKTHTHTHKLRVNTSCLSMHNMTHG